MNEPEKKKDMDAGRIGKTTDNPSNQKQNDSGVTGRIDFREEYRDGFTKRLYIEQYQRMALQNWIDRFPADVILEKVAQLENPDTTKEVKEQLNTNVQSWLEELDHMNDSSKDLNIDILKTASILARRDRERLEKQ